MVADAAHTGKAAGEVATGEAAEKPLLAPSGEGHTGVIPAASQSKHRGIPESQKTLTSCIMHVSSGPRAARSDMLGPTLHVVGTFGTSRAAAAVAATAAPTAFTWCP